VQTLDAYGRFDAAFTKAAASHRPTPLADIPVDDCDRDEIPLLCKQKGG
jgi:hypothetical protein